MADPPAKPGRWTQNRLYMQMDTPPSRSAVSSVPAPVQLVYGDEQASPPPVRAANSGGNGALPAPVQLVYGDELPEAPTAHMYYERQQQPSASTSLHYDTSGALPTPVQLVYGDEQASPPPAQKGRFIEEDLPPPPIPSRKAAPPKSISPHASFDCNGYSITSSKEQQQKPPSSGHGSAATDAALSNQRSNTSVNSCRATTPDWDLGSTRTSSTGSNAAPQRVARLSMVGPGARRDSGGASSEMEDGYKIVKRSGASVEAAAPPLPTKRTGTTSSSNQSRHGSGGSGEEVIWDYPWYHGAVPRQAAEETLSGFAAGSFLVRDTSSPPNLALSVVTRSKMNHLLIIVTDEVESNTGGSVSNVSTTYQMEAGGGKKFRTLGALVEQLKNEPTHEEHGGGSLLVNGVTK